MQKTWLLRSKQMEESLTIKAGPSSRGYNKEPVAVMARFYWTRFKFACEQLIREQSVLQVGHSYRSICLPLELQPEKFQVL